ncbi:flagellar assembly protein FliW [Clostridium beijerinckii]|uniref:flagellar assembly protein FliW n=1 Tax=Clostridium beijerinckii TaxID=1520 RepID=UPI00098BF8D8|nr:flagellar assembly protein FliW [Clostridium beijerinckii]MBA8933020.1 flagellar assembly factor FliW [Clostridium beijerinckii]NRU37223.1 flagellar assembly factor FliW [Clostridium beijerinckii]NSA99498.1 flagellar assembly factor FliW [Clostridium beijerinckii]OOM64653.1 flagellar assembly factor FliW [Clostridium beijerinckii]OOM72374.1 flagellar assembly factor FliW [Clostridium beijerinckii]
MVFISKIHGKLEYDEKDIIIFKKEILGFNNKEKFVLVELEDYKPFKLLQSLEDEEVGLILTSPFEFFDDYKVNLPEETLNRLNIDNEEDVLLLTTITLSSDPKKITANLKAPIIINKKANLAEQIIIDDSKYNIKHPLIKE